MCQTPHLVIGAACGAVLKNPALGFLIGVISHAALDLIPHYDQADHFRLKKYKTYVIITAILDFILGSIIVCLLIYNKSSIIIYSAIFGAVGGVLIDLLDMVLGKYLWKGFRKTFIGKFIHKIHPYLHSHQIKNYWYLGIITQTILVLTGFVVIYLS